MYNQRYKAIWLIIVLFFQFETSYAQVANRQDSIVFDGFSWKFTNIPMVVEEGSMITVIYHNVNPFITHSGLISTNITNSYEDGSDVFNSLKAATASQTATDAKADSAAETAAVGAEKAEVMALREEMFAEPVKTTKDLKGIRHLLKEKTTYLNNIDYCLNTIQISINKIHNLMLADSCIILAKSQSYNRSKELMLADIQARTPEIPSTPDAIQTSFNAEVHTIQTTIYSIKSLINILESINENLKQLDPNLEFDNVIDTLQKDATNLSKIYSDTNLSKMSANISNTVNDYVTAIRSDYTVYGDTILSATGDYISISDQKFGIKSFKIKTYNGTRIDFSLGILATIGDVNGWEYSLNKINDSTSYVLTNKEPKQIAFSPVAFVHLYTTRKTNIAWMLSFGAAPDLTTLANTKFLLGASFAGFSSNEIIRRLIFSAGLACGAADVLKAKYLEKTRDKDFNFNSFGNISDADLTEKAFKVGGYFAVTWNLGGIGH